MQAAYGRLATTLTATLLLLSGCTLGPASVSRDSGPRGQVKVDHIPDAVPKHEKRTRAGNPKTYVVMGKRYHVMKESTGYVERGIASWYGKKFHGRKTSNGETYDMYAMTAAHKTLPIPAYVQVTNLDNGRQVVVRVNDRGPFHEGRIIDLSYTAAKKLDIIGHGTGRVEVRALEPGQPMPATTRTASTPTRPSGARVEKAIAPKGSEPKPTLYLQLGSFISMDNAESLRARLALNNVSGASILRTSADRKQVYRVRVGPLKSVREADRIASRINDLGLGVPTIIID
ncbi:MAG: septal ring lytic transglycosylase RlpA family protein [Pseudomonadota bacterium]